MSVVAALFSSHSSLAAQAPGGTIEIVSAGRVELEPGATETTVARVTATEATGPLVVHTWLPDGWSRVAAGSAVRIEPGDTAIELIPIVVSSDAIAGDYPVGFELIAEGGTPQGRRDAVVMFSVSEVRRLEVRGSEDLVNAYVGSPVRTTFEVRNVGNTDLDVQLEAVGVAKDAASLSWTHDRLPPGVSREVEVSMRTAALSNREEPRITLRANAERTTRVSATTRFQLLSLGRAPNADVSNSLDAEVGFRSGTDRPFGLSSMRAKGYLDRDDRYAVDFQYFLAERHLPYVRSLDALKFSLLGPTVSLHAGDRLWALSPLTETGWFARGAGGEYRGNRFNLYGHVAEDRSSSFRGEMSGGVGLDVGLFDWLNVSGQGLLRRGGVIDAEIGSVRVKVTPTDWLRADAEVGRGWSDAGTGAAASVGFYGSLQNGSFALRSAFADREYPSRTRNLLRTDFEFSYAFTSWLRLRGSANGSERVSTAKFLEDAPDRRISQQVSAQIISRASVAARRDRWVRGNGEWDDAALREVITASISIPQVLGISIRPRMEMGRAQKAGAERPVSLMSAGVNASVSGNRGRSKVSAELIRTRSGAGDDAQASWSTSVSARTTALGTDLTLRAMQLRDDTNPWRSNFRWLEFTAERSIIRDHRVSLGMISQSSDAFGEQRGPVYRLEYLVPIRLPVPNSSDQSGVIEVELVDLETGRPAEGVLVIVDGKLVLTDGSGRARFPGLAPGTYDIAVNVQSVGNDRTTVPAQPPLAVVEGGDTRVVHVGITRTGTISGTLLRSSEPIVLVADDITGRPVSQELTGVRNVNIELSTAFEKRTTRTDAQGRFSFGYVIPGDWTLRVVDPPIEPFHQLQFSTMSGTIGPGEILEVSFQIVPKEVVVGQADFTAVE